MYDKMSYKYTDFLSFFLPYKIKYLLYFIHWHRFCIYYSKQLKYNICMIYYL